MSTDYRPKAPPILSNNQRLKLETWASQSKSIQRLAQRAKIILVCGDGLENKAVVARLQVNPLTVGRWRRRFLDHGLGGLADDPRPVTPGTITDAKLAVIVT